MFFLQYKVKPDPQNDDLAEFGGAFVSCWINREKQEEAEKTACEMIEKEHWMIDEKLEVYEVHEEQYLDYPELLHYYLQAEIDQEVLVFDTWPAEE